MARGLLISTLLFVIHAALTQGAPSSVATFVSASRSPLAGVTTSPPPATTSAAPTATGAPADVSSAPAAPPTQSIESPSTAAQSTVRASTPTNANNDVTTPISANTHTQGESTASKNDTEATTSTNDTEATTSTNDTATTSRNPATHTPSLDTTTPIGDLTHGPLNSTTTTAHVVGSVKDLSRSPGLIAVLSIFVIILALLLVVGIAKGITTGTAKFERLDEVPMSNMNEGSPFAQYPPK